MGTINYKTGDIITLGVNENSLEDWEEVNDYTEDAMDYIKDLADELKDKLEQFNVVWLKFNVEYGYYAGMSVNIDKDYQTDAELERDNTISRFLKDLWKLDKEEKEEVRMQLDLARQFCIECLDYLDVCYPSWCTGYEEGYAENVNTVNNAFDKAIKELGL
jgi:hypothetical protein